jgi:hypothetical protein
MNYTTIFEAAPDNWSVFSAIIPLVFLALLGFGVVFALKRIQKGYSFWRQVAIFTGYIFGVGASIFLILILSHTPGIVSEKQNLNNSIKTENYLITEGEVENFTIIPSNGQVFESFIIDGVYFEYSDFIIYGGFNQTSNNGGPISHDGQHFRISYLIRFGENVIMKIEKSN